MFSAGRGVDHSGASGLLRRLLVALIGEPTFEIAAEEADVASDAQAWEAAVADCFVDPTGSDGEQRGGLVRLEQRPLEPGCRPWRVEA